MHRNDPAVLKLEGRMPRGMAGVRIERAAKKLGIKLPTRTGGK